MAPTRGSPFTTTMRVVHGVHRHTAHCRADTTPTGGAGFAERAKPVLAITNLAEGGTAFHRDSSCLTGP